MAKIWERRDHLLAKLEARIDRIQERDDLDDVTEILLVVRDILLANAYDMNGQNATKAMLALVDMLAKREQILGRLKEEGTEDIEEELDRLLDRRPKPITEAG